MDRIRKYIDKTLFQEDITLETRLSIFFILVGIVASLLGFITCIAAGVSREGSIVVLIIAISIPMVLNLAYKNLKMETISFIILVSIIIIMPIVWLTAGGVKSGVNIWFVYEFFFIAITLKGDKFKYALIFAIVADVLCYVFNWFAPDYVYVLEDNRSIFISTFCSLVIVATSIVITTLYYKKIYDEEKGKLKEANNFQKEFMGTFSHELRSPINAILGLNEMIIQSQSIEEIREYALEANEAGENLMYLINDILDYSKYEAGGMMIVPKEYSPMELLNKSYVLMSNRAKSKGLEFQIKNNPSVPSVLCGDEERIKQIITNLLINAVKYTDVGSICIVMTSEYLDDDNILLRIDVIDSGIGIARENIDAIFESFQKMEVGDRSVQGVGLGLTITKKLVDKMNGTIEVSSELGRGSIFTVKIPQKIINRTPMGSYTRKVKRNMFEKKEEFKAPSARILVVDDMAVNLKVTEGLLKKTQMTIITAISGREALDILERESFDIVLLDHMMPEMDGVEVLREIRKNDVDTPVIVLTANALTGVREEYLEFGFTDYISKPIKPVELNRILMQYLPEQKIQSRNLNAEKEK